ncbi:MAG TPA: MYXO-CTERM sorting domain-containing protein, partial [Nannocystis sp.]
YGGYCGDGQCTGPENDQNCPQDCGPPEPTDGGGQCGDGTCDPNENPQICPEDCPAVCGDGLCTHDENPMTCPQDCGGDTESASGGECPDTASGGDQCQLDDDGCGCAADGDDTRGLWASLLLFGVFGIRRARKRA